MIILNKYHALYNDYLVLNAKQVFDYHILSQKLCRRNDGLGSDGLLIGPLPSKVADFKLRIFNPDGSEAEKSGNGIRIFCKYLYDCNYVANQAFTLETNGGIVSCIVENDGNKIKVMMGKPIFNSHLVDTPHMTYPLTHSLQLQDRVFTFCSVSIGNPHCVVIDSQDISKDVKDFGREIENHNLFKNRTNVQFVRALNSEEIKIEIWERGAGYTLASGSSSVAAAAVAYKLKLCSSNVKVSMPGGSLEVSFDDDFNCTITGNAEFVYECAINI